MAIFDWHMQTITRSAEKTPSRSAVAAAAYRSGTCLRDHRTGAEHDYTRRRGIYSMIILPPDVVPPSLVRPNSRSEMRSRLWNAAEAAETRRNSVVAREITLALPHELSPDDARRLARTYAQHIAQMFDVAVDIAVHPPDQEGDQRNVHAHILFTTRRVSDGFVFGKKIRELDAAVTGGPIIKALREKWADFANLVLLEAGVEVAIDHRSLADRGIDRAPRRHVGPQATNLARKLRAKAARLLAEAEEIEQLEGDRLRRQVPAVVIIEERDLGPIGPFRAPRPVEPPTPTMPSAEDLEAVVRDAAEAELFHKIALHSDAQKRLIETEAAAEKKRQERGRAKAPSASSGSKHPKRSAYPHELERARGRRYADEDLPKLTIPQPSRKKVEDEDEKKPKAKPTAKQNAAFVNSLMRSRSRVATRGKSKGRSRGRER